MSKTNSQKSFARSRQKRRFKPEALQVLVEGSLRFDDPSAGRSRGRGRPRGKLGATSQQRIRHVAQWLLAGEKQREITPKLFPNLQKEVAYARTRSFLNRYRREISETLKGKIVEELADSMQEGRLEKRGRPLGKLRMKTRKRIEFAARYSLAGKSHRAVALELFQGFSKEIAYARTRDFFRRYRSLIGEAKQSLREALIEARRCKGRTKGAGKSQRSH